VRVSGFVTIRLRFRSQSSSNSRIYSNGTTKGLNRYYGNHDLHFITCSCYHRQPELDPPERRNLSRASLKKRPETHFAGGVVIFFGFVVNFHLLIAKFKSTSETVSGFPLARDYISRFLSCLT
jgi:hypothetical protein